MRVQGLRLLGSDPAAAARGAAAVALIAAAVALLAAGPALAQFGPAPPLPGDEAIGNPRAKVTVVEYASAACPHCADFNNRILPAFKAKYVITGKVRYILREVLTPPNEVAAAGFLLARCAGEGKYFSTLDDFFHGQARMYRSGDALGLINSVGAKAGLSPAAIKACLSDEDARNELNARIERNKMEDMITYTPTFVINGLNLPQRVHEVNLADLDAAIAEAGRR